MKHSDFVDLVRKTRAAQKDFYRDRSNTNLQRAMKLEKLLDAELESIPVAKQQSFDF